MSKKISFDFDYTLDKPFVQDYARELIQSEYEIWIVTSRYDSIEKCFELGSFKTDSELVRAQLRQDLDFLFIVAEELGIPENHIVFTNMQYKNTYFKDHEDFLFHLDDNVIEYDLINSHTRVPCVLCNSRYDWKSKCQEIIQKSQA